jgi:type IV pilus assembly protein PilM
MGTVSLIGLDIGSDSIRAAETRHDKGGVTITRFGRVPLPRGVVRGGVINDEKAVTGALRQLWTTGRFRGRKVVLGVTNRQVVVREMSVTNLPPRELKQSLPFQVRHVLPLPVENALLDFYPLEDAGSSKTVRGLLIAAPKEPVLTAVQATEHAGLHVARVDLASFALLRATARLDEGVEAIVDIGAHTTTVVIHRDGEPLIVRTVPRGGAEITDTIAQRLDLSFEAADELKRRVGLRDGEEPGAQDVIAGAVRPLINEIRSSFAYLTAGDQPARVERLGLTGGGCALPGLADVLSADLGVGVVIADPLARLRDCAKGARGDVEQSGPAAAVAIGLTLGTGGS